MKNMTAKEPLLIKCTNCGKERNNYRTKRTLCSRCFRKSTTKKFKNCIVCNKDLQLKGGKFCSDTCRDIQYKPQPRACIQCGTNFIPLTSARHCSKECRAKTDKERNFRRRALVTATRIESINPNIVFKRHNWHCNMCGKATPKELRGKFHNDSPTIDHIIPLSKGGKHRYSNMQLLCQYCNCSVKRNNLIPLRSINMCNPCITRSFSIATW